MKFRAHNFGKWEGAVKALRKYAARDDVHGINGIIDRLTQDEYLDLWWAMRLESALRSKIKKLRDDHRNGVEPEHDEPDPRYIDPLPLD